MMYGYSPSYLKRCIRRLEELDAPKEEWRCEYVTDVADEDEDIVEYETCQLCNCPRVRFVHHMKHRAYPKILDVGCECAGLLEGDVLELDYLQTDCGVSVNIFSVGADARISAGMQKYKRLPGLGGSAAYIASIGEHFIRGLCRPCRVEVDGRVFDGKQTLVLAANGRFYGGGFYPTPDADPADGWMDVVIVHGVSRLTAAKVIGMYQKGNAKDLPEYITVLRAKEMTITSTDGKPFVLNLDGENRPADSLRVWVPQRKMHFVVPRGVEILPPGTGVTPLKK